MLNKQRAVMAELQLAVCLCQRGIDELQSIKLIQLSPSHSTEAVLQLAL